MRSSMTPGRRFSGSVSNVFTYGGNDGCAACGIAGDGGSTKSGAADSLFFSVCSPPIAGLIPLFGFCNGLCSHPFSGQRPHAEEELTISPVRTRSLPRSRSW